MTRQTPIVLEGNRKFKTKTERLKFFRMVRDALKIELQNGYNPYEDESTDNLFTAEKSIRFALKIICKNAATSTVRSYNSLINQFIDYLRSKGKNILPVNEITRKDLVLYLEQVSNGTGSKNHNNARSALLSVFKTLLKHELVDINHLESIDKLKEKPKKHRPYTDEQAKLIFDYLDINDSIMLLFIKVCGYNMLRPVEACRLKVKDIDLDKAEVYVNPKNDDKTIRRIPSILIDDLKQLNLSNPDHLLFTPGGVGEWLIEDEDARRNYFSKRFLKIKRSLSLGKEYDIYSFRHYFITKAFKKLRESFTEDESITKLLPITCHKTREALMKYLRSIDAEIAEDYSDLLR